MDTNQIKYTASQLIEEVASFIELVEARDLTNEQWFLNFLDELNELSIKH